MANTKGTRGRKPGKTPAKQAEPVENTTDNKVVKFEKKTPAPDFEGTITYIKIPVKKEIQKHRTRDGRIYRGFTKVMPVLSKRLRNPE